MISIKEYTLNPKLCLKCKKQLSFDRKHFKFCNNNCRISHNNASRFHSKNNDSNCIICNKLITRFYSKHTYCSVDCSNIHKENIRINDFTLGRSSSKICKNILIKQYGNKCMECGWDKINLITGKCPVELEHMDGNHTNNKPDNLKLLCPNCHSLTATYKALNKGNGRKRRMEKYFENKNKTLDKNDI